MIRSIFHKLARDTHGSTIVEFAILAPVIFGLAFGVIQVGLNMQQYNAMRSISSETARYTIVEYMNKRKVTNTQIAAEAKTIATSSPYLLKSNFTATVTDVTTPRVAGTFEKTLTVTYTPPSFLPFFNWTSGKLTFTRPIFVIDE